MINLFTGKDCSGCTACVYSCPVQCITMQKDFEGFQYPVIDHSKCIECKACLKICSFNNDYTLKLSYIEPLVYAAKHINESIRLESSSGGLFIVFSDEILKLGGIIYGAAFSNDYHLMHKRAIKYEERNLMIGSKYVQSDLGSTYVNIEKDLKKGNSVMFIGTPCQTAGLFSYLRADYINLLVIDILCYSVPSPKIFMDFVEKQIKNNINKNIAKITFRSKENVGWRASSRLLFHFNDSIIIEEKGYLPLFYKCLINRPSCHNCKFTNTKRASDITIGDFWNIDKVSPAFDDDKGVSCLIINTQKGKQYLEKISPNLILLESEMKNIMQSCLIRPSVPSLLRENFWNDYRHKGFSYIEKKYGNYSKFETFRRKYLVWLTRFLRKLGFTKLIRYLKKSF